MEPLPHFTKNGCLHQTRAHYENLESIVDFSHPIPSNESGCCHGTDGNGVIVPSRRVEEDPEITHKSLIRIRIESGKIFRNALARTDRKGKKKEKSLCQNPDKNSRSGKLPEDSPDKSWRHRVVIYCLTTTPLKLRENVLVKEYHVSTD